jgi:rSAM/selenodomain-associated transferase 1
MSLLWPWPWRQSFLGGIESLAIRRRANEVEASMSGGLDWHLRSTCAFAVMAKASIAGKTKTRLVPPLTEDEAARLNTVFLRDAADNILSAARLVSIRGWMAFSPAGAESFFTTHLPESIGLVEAVAPSLGECLHYAAATLLRAGHGAVCLVNSDSPTLPVSYLVTAATVLAASGDHIVLGPSTDGGYYLIGMKRPRAGLFEDIAWSTDQVFSQTLARARALGVSVVELPTWYDVDNEDTLQLLIQEVLDGRPFRDVGAATLANWTRGYLSTLARDSGLRERICAGRAAGGGVAG